MASCNCSSPRENDKAAAPLDWTSRPFCRENTQSEPEDLCEEGGSSEEELECLRCCTDYYYSSKRASVELGGDAEGSHGRRAVQFFESDSSESDDAAAAVDADGSELGGAQRRNSLTLAQSRNDEDSEEGEQLLAVRSTLGSELAEGLRLVFFIALPMLARQLGSVLSRRLLARLFGRYSP